MNMDNIEISKYFELKDEDKIYVNRYVLSILDYELQRLQDIFSPKESIQILIDGLIDKKEIYEINEDYEYCQIISNIINVLKNKLDAIS
jgi:hypothetical protein